MGLKFGVTEAVAILLLVLIGISLYRAQRDKTFISFNLFDLLMEHGRLSRLAFVFFAAFFVHTWIMIRLTLDGKISEGYMTFYGMTWAAPIVVKMFSSPQQPSSTVTETKTEIIVSEPSKKE